MEKNWHPAVAAAQGREERWLKPHQVAKLFGCTIQHVRRLCRQGKLGGIKTTERNLVIPLSAVEDYRNNINQ